MSLFLFSSLLESVKVKMIVAQSYPALFDTMDYSPPASSIHGILHARILEWEPFPSPGDLHDPEVNPGSPALQADSLLSEIHQCLLG